jgi:hypothetical protein
MMPRRGCRACSLVGAGEHFGQRCDALLDLQQAGLAKVPDAFEPGLGAMSIELPFVMIIRAISSEIGITW